jgi:hypothetical protein
LIFRLTDGRRFSVSHYRRGLNKLDQLLRPQLAANLWETGFRKMLRAQFRMESST